MVADHRGGWRFDHTPNPPGMPVARSQAVSVPKSSASETASVESCRAAPSYIRQAIAAVHCGARSAVQIVICVRNIDGFMKRTY